MSVWLRRIAVAALLAAAGSAMSAQGLAPLARIPAASAPVPAPFEETRIVDLGHRGPLSDWVAEPDQGMRHRSVAGTVWWGWGRETDEPRPTIVLLHGSDRTGESMVDTWREVAEREGLVLVAPDLGGVAGWDRGVPDPRVLMDALADAATRYPVDPARVALFGHSRGAIAAQAIANRVSGPWRAVAIHAGTVNPEAMQPVAGGLPIRHYLGAQDELFPYAQALASARAIAARGHP